jgi:hypothetical protein
MLKEAEYVRQFPGEPKCRWFTDDFFDLILWVDESENPVGFQLCYDRRGDSRAITWHKEKGYSHHGVDEGENGALQPKATPILVQDGIFDTTAIYQAFSKAGAGIDQKITKFILERIKNYV